MEGLCGCHRSVRQCRPPMSIAFGHMMRIISLLVFSFLSLTLAGPVAAQSPRLVERPDLASLFTGAGVTGTMVVHDHAKDIWVVVGPQRAATGYLPASTFKIFNALTALDRGVVADVDGEGFASTAKGSDGFPALPPQCEGHITMRTAFRFSCVPVFQTLARRIGADAFQRLITQVGYGNGQIAAVPVDRFWLEGAYRVTAFDQVRLLDRLYQGDLPFSLAAQSAVKDIMRQSDAPAGTIIRGKTGYVTSITPAVGWWVGWVERDGHAATFALNVDITDPARLTARQSVAKAVLSRLGLLP